jgi:uncharacterized protein YndB with AHSA1/START domain
VIAFEASEIIDETPENVYAFVEDTDMAPLWLIKVTKTEKVTEGAIRAGTRFRETRMHGDREVTGEIEVVRHDGPPDQTQPPFHHSATSTAMGVQVIYHYTFDATDDGKTRMSLQAELIPKTLLGRFTCHMLSASLKREDSDQLTFLKKAIEEDPTLEDDDGP